MEIKISTREILKSLYIDYMNNYLTIATYADHVELTEKQAQVLINLAREVYNSKHPEA